MKNGVYWHLFTAKTISTLGDCFGFIAFQWLVYTTTGSLLVMGTLSMVSGVSAMLVQFLGAPLLDRVNRIKLMYFLDLLRFLAIGITVVLGLCGLTKLWILFCMAILTSAGAALFNPASMAVLPSILKDKNIIRGYSLMDTSQYAAVIMGPALAGMVIAMIGAELALAFDSISFVASALFIFLASRKQEDKKPNAERADRAYYRELWAGIQFFKQAPSLLWIMCCVALKNMCSVAVGGMMIPFALQVLHANAFQVGLLTSATAVGLLIGSLLVSIICDFPKRRLPMLGSIIVQGLLYLILGFTHSFVFALCCTFVSGICGPFFGSFSSSIYAQLVPEQLRGRVMSARLLIGGSLQPAGSFLGGMISSFYGIPFLFAIAGAIPMMVGTLAYFLPALKGIDGKLTTIKLKSNLHVPLKQ